MLRRRRRAASPHAGQVPDARVTVWSGPFLARFAPWRDHAPDAKLHCHRKLHEGLTGFVTWRMVGVFPHSTLARGALTLLRTSRPPFGISSDFLEAAWMW